MAGSHLEKSEKIRWPRFVKTELLPGLKGFSAQGRLLYEQPLAEILRAFYIEVSGFESNVAYVECFILPLYVPQTVLSFSFGRRIQEPSTGRSRWNIPADCPEMLRGMREQGLPFLHRFQAPKDLALRLGTEVVTPTDPYTQEAVAYSWILAAQPSEAMTVLERQCSRLDVSVSWEIEMRARASSLLQDLRRGNIQEAIAKLRGWRNDSIHNLKLSSSQG